METILYIGVVLVLTAMLILFGVLGDRAYKENKKLKKELKAINDQREDVISQMAVFYSDGLTYKSIVMFMGFVERLKDDKEKCNEEFRRDLNVLHEALKKVRRYH